MYGTAEVGVEALISLRKSPFQVLILFLLTHKMDRGQSECEIFVIYAYYDNCKLTTHNVIIISITRNTTVI